MLISPSLSRLVSDTIVARFSSTVSAPSTFIQYGKTSQNDVGRPIVAIRNGINGVRLLRGKVLKRRASRGSNCLIISTNDGCAAVALSGSIELAIRLAYNS